jgi:hypothetical protein
MGAQSLASQCQREEDAEGAGFSAEEGLSDGVGFSEGEGDGVVFIVRLRTGLKVKP